MIGERPEVCADAIADFLAGDPEIRDKQDAAYAQIVALCESIQDPRLHALCLHFLTLMGERFSGIWKNGCLVQKGRVVAIGVERSTCHGRGGSPGA